MPQQDTSSLDALQSSFDSELERARARHALRSAVRAALDPLAGVPLAVHDHAYCGDVSLEFEYHEGSYLKLLEAYPAEPLVLAYDSSSMTQKPAAYLRDNEAHGHVLPLAPYLDRFTKSKTGLGSLCWWTRLRSGHFAQLQLRNAPYWAFTSLVCAPRFSLDSHTYATGSTSYGLRMLAEPKTQESALVAWLDAWREFSAREDYSATQQWLLDTVMTGVLRDLRRIEAPDKRMTRWLSGLGAPSQAFDAEGEKRFYEFCSGQDAAWPQARAADAAQAQQVADAFEELVQSGRPAADDSVVWRYLMHAVAAKTGLVPLMRIATRRANGSMELDIRFANQRDIGSHVIDIRSPMERSLRAQDIPVTYVE